MTLTDNDYRILPRVANSDLTDLQGYLLPHRKQEIKASPLVLHFGTIFHQMVLEPFKLIDWTPFPEEQRPITRLTLNRMVEALFAGVEGDTLHHQLKTAQTEVVAQWEDEETGVPCKGKLDIRRLSASARYIIIHDLKTTACKTQAAFEKCCIDYGYDRQAAFYLDSDPLAEYFEITGIQKADPFNVYRLAFHRHSDFVAGGRRQNRRLLRSAAEQLNKPNGWRPRSWGRKEVVSE